MKVILVGLTLLTSLSTFAAQKCNIRGYASIFLENGKILRNHPLKYLKYRVTTDSLEDCYLFALKKAKRQQASKILTITKFRRSKNTLAHVYFKWIYEDSIIPFFYSTGRVTKYTDKYETYPSVGDFRYFIGGEVFE